MDYEKKIEIPFGAFDSELIHQEINIPNGFNAAIKGNKIILTKIESEDELTWLTNYIQEEAYSLSMDIRGNEDRVKLKKLRRSLAWLEKQGEQKPIIEMKSPEESLGISSKEYNDIVNECLYGESKTDEPKFKVGNWYQCIKDFFGKGVTFDKNTAYYCAKEGCLQNEYGCHIAIVKDLYDNFKLWTIKDAKPGDILFHSDSASNGIFIFKELLKYEFSEKVICYCDYDSEDYFCLGEHHTCCWADAKILHPATKEQRDTLFTKMKEAGYEWDAEKKELNKIEQKPSWSEEDEEYINDLIGVFDGQQYQAHSDEEIVKWLKSIRLPYNKEWDENDEEMLRSIIATCELAEQDRDSSPARHLLEMQLNWLKSLKPQSQWNPSDEQMEIIDMLLTNEAMDDNVARVLRELKEQLKKLKGE